MPSRILSALRNMTEKLIPNPNKETSIENPFINNDNYVDGLVEP
jgi:hypothetical protein